MGSLDIPNETFLNECLPLESSSNVKSNIILHTVDDVLRQLRTKQEIFALLLTDAAWYMSLAGKTLKKLYPTSMHITCIAHLLHKFIMRARAFFKNIYDVVRDGNRSGRPAPVGFSGRTGYWSGRESSTSRSSWLKRRSNSSFLRLKAI